MFFLNYATEAADSLKSKYREVAEQYKGEGISFLIGDSQSSQAALNVCILFCFVWLFKLLTLFSNMTHMLNTLLVYINSILDLRKIKCLSFLCKKMIGLSM